jgi:hypothetical protein
VTLTICSDAAPFTRWVLPLDNVNKARCSAPTVADGEPLVLQPTSIDPSFLGRSLQIKGMRSRGNVQHEMILPVAVRWRLRPRASRPQSLPQHAVIGTVMDIQTEHTVEAYLLPVGNVSVCVCVLAV